MQLSYHPAASRGHANHGWLNTHHTFSFAGYHDPDRMNFGVLRVLNDDEVAPAHGFGSHPHDNMEIISIPLEGDLEHKDNMGNVTVIKQGDIQVMSAGTGVVHSEKNRNKNKQVKFLQIWVIPRERDVEPRYDQVSMDLSKEKNDFNVVLSPNKDASGVWIHQDAWFSIIDLDPGVAADYQLHKQGNGVYAFVLEGAPEVAGKQLARRDGLGIAEVKQINFSGGDAGARVLVMEVPR